MFSGIIQTTGSIVGIKRHQGDISIEVDAGSLALDEIGIGDSIAVSGPCLTVTAISNTGLSFDISAETIKRTHFGSLALGQIVNLERSMTIGAEVNGHLVSGHVDGLGSVQTCESDARSTRLVVETSRELAAFIAEKGSISVDGISLTVNAVRDTPEAVEFDVNIIPHTMAVTSLASIRPGHRVHLEVDMIARYLQRIVQVQGTPTGND